MGESWSINTESIVPQLFTDRKKGGFLPDSSPVRKQGGFLAPSCLSCVGNLGKSPYWPVILFILKKLTISLVQGNYNLDFISDNSAQLAVKLAMGYEMTMKLKNWTGQVWCLFPGDLWAWLICLEKLNYRMVAYLPTYQSQKMGQWVKTVCMYITKEQETSQWSLGNFND